MSTSLCPQCHTPLRAVDGLCPACVARVITSFVKQPASLTGDDEPEIPGYEIIEIIGRGGMGVVYRALRLDDEIEVALKLMPAHLAGRADLLERLQREAQTLRQLDHPYILRILDSGITADGRWFMATELATGGDLGKRLQTGPIPVAEALRLFGETLQALAHAHAKGIAHRDIKPANILLAADGSVRVADFSLAKLLRDNTTPQFSLTQTTEVFGTPYYIAPELRRGSGNVDERADIFSLGVLLHEMLTGRLPIGNYEPASKLTDISKHIDRLISRCLQEDPAKRPQAVAAVTHELNRKPRKPLGCIVWTLVLLTLGYIGSDGFWMPGRGTPTTHRPWRNSLGVKFVPLPGTNVLVSTWETRIRDFTEYSDEMKLPLTGPETRWRHAAIGNDINPDHPVTPVSKVMTDRFCDWLTQRERQQGLITSRMRYRLPSEAEWSLAAAEPETAHSDKFTSPVGSQAPNQFGIHDLHGNVAEWTSTPWSPTNTGDFIIRGASYLPLDDRHHSRAIFQTDGVGFRVVLELPQIP
ncbi:MAG: bifunctional serine/threonine-protein kinase/formylglycine-generating enzyme family protein [Prosthecobacter sp.]|uniref:bifunctional serine/threonine-protein kinase/formylglycine-generating enzyme family protein n=1 Tax=Prosthecobacter sp. TaxID=1965333 RepID=UPI0038FFBEE6